jgi:hypothetical protein
MQGGKSFIPGTGSDAKGVSKEEGDSWLAEPELAGVISLPLLRRNDGRQFRVIQGSKE